MDKRKVIDAYRRGFITMQECAQILGVDFAQITSIVSDPQYKEHPRLRVEKKPVNE
ncbi:MAG TPA: hypothetical protein VF260_10610 [Bacilli bacterium]